MTNNNMHPLTAEINNQDTPPGTIAVWWTGQSGFIIKGGEIVICLDPWLATGGQFTPAPVLPAEVTNADFLLCSHSHGDHLSIGTTKGIMEASPQSTLILPPAATKKAKDGGLDEKRTVPIYVGKPQMFKTDGQEIHIEAIPAKHNEFDYDKNAGGYPYVGYLISLNGALIYHSGDTLIYETDATDTPNTGLADYLRDKKIDIAFLPINGRSAAHLEGYMYNMDSVEAADLAAEIGADVVIPMHWGWSTVNTGDPTEFVRYIKSHHPALRYHVMILERDSEGNPRWEKFVYKK
jgi:L-ascorbate metabolism protein UlaG (beta-lactamase superfamily)